MNNLDFLKKFEIINDNKYAIINFLKNDFNDDIWFFEFNKVLKKEKIIDFKIRLQDDSFLTDIKNKRTLLTFKTLIMEFLIRDEMYKNSENTILQGINGILNFFGLINTYDLDKSFASNGFEVIDKDFLINIFNKRLENKNLFFVYNGEYYFKKLLKELNFNIKDEYNKKDIIDLNNIIKNKNINIQEKIFPYAINNVQFSFEEIFLNENKSFKYITEFDGHFRNDVNNKAVYTTINPFLKSIEILKHMINFNDNNLSLPFKNNLEFILNYNFKSKKIKHFETFPINIIFDVLKKSIEFHYKYGESIKNSYKNFVREIKNNNLDNINLNTHLNKKTKEIVDNIIINCIEGELKNIGIECYFNTYDENYFNELRENKSFYSLLKVYYGCSQFITGALMARRQSEINSLEVDCFDDINMQLSFRKSKSYQHSFGIKDYISLPAPEIVIDVLKNINEIAKEMISLTNNKKLMFIPNAYRPLTYSEDNTKMYDNLDTLFDYFEVDLIENKRPYIRQHQLRRFFAMAFFWSNGYKSIDTLRWFLGHTNSEHVYNYIKENNTGEVLNNVKAQYVSENIESFSNLSDIFKNRFNVENYYLLSKEDLADYINTLLEDGEITVEPEFIVDDNKNMFEIILKVKK